MRINAFLARSGTASRRKADELIKAGRVKVNGTIASLNTQVGEGDDVKLDDKLVASQNLRYVLVHKPAGYITTMVDPERRPKVVDLVNLPETLKPVGRLDFNTSGLLLLTNDGQLANKLMHPSRKIEKTYEVLVKGEITERILNLLSNGVNLEDGRTAPAVVKKVSHNTLHLTIHEGKNRQVRRMMEAVGLKLTKLTRIKYGPLEIDKLPVGKWRELSSDEINRLTRVADAKISSNGKETK